jgi:isoleucyl-tRNA synthetase
MDAVRNLAELGQAARGKAGLKVRQPLGRMQVTAADRALVPDLLPFLPLLQEELNVKAVRFVDSGDSSGAGGGLYRLSARLDAKKGKPKYGRHFAALAQALAGYPPSEVESRLREGALHIEVEGESFALEPGEIVIEKTAEAGWEVAEGNGFLVALDTRLDEALLREGNVRDLVRHIQSLRKQLGLAVADRIRLRYQAGDEVAATLEAARDYLAEETLAGQIERSADPLETGLDVKLGEETVRIAVERA